MNPIHRHKVISVGYQAKQNMKSCSSKLFYEKIFWKVVRKFVLLQALTDSARFFKKSTTIAGLFWPKGPILILSLCAKYPNIYVSKKLAAIRSSSASSGSCTFFLCKSPHSMIIHVSHYDIYIHVSQYDDVHVWHISTGQNVPHSFMSHITTHTHMSHIMMIIVSHYDISTKSHTSHSMIIHISHYDKYTHVNTHDHHVWHYDIFTRAHMSHFMIISVWHYDISTNLHMSHMVTFDILIGLFWHTYRSLFWHRIRQIHKSLYFKLCMPCCRIHTWKRPINL